MWRDFYWGCAHETESIPLTEYSDMRVPEYSEEGFRTGSVPAFLWEKLKI
jgi:hypothetical protein